MSQQLLITDGTVVDGGGGDPFPGDVLVRDGRILAVVPPGTILPGDDVRVLSARGQTLAPGFIDVHSHADLSPLLGAPDTTKILQGITTEVVGNCGIAAAPLPGGEADRRSTAAKVGHPPGTGIPWTTHAELFAHTDALGYVTNQAPLAGHGTLRSAVLGMADRLPSADELKAMRVLLEEALEAGVFGLSSGLIYPPGVFSDTAELTALAAGLGPDGLYTTHMRGESDGLLTSIAEAVSIGEGAGCRVHISHLKSAGRRNWGRMPTALRAITQAAENGLRITKDVYPYTAGSTMLATCLPPSWLAGGDAVTLDRLGSPGAREELRAALSDEHPTWNSFVADCGWDGLLVASTTSHRYEGATLAEIAVLLGTDPVDALITVLREEALGATMVAFAMHEDDVTAALASPDTMIGTDGVPAGLGGRPHPRLYGTFPRVLGRYVRERGVLTLGEAVRRMTSLAAETFRIPERGWIRPGHIADLVAFDAAGVVDRGDYTDPVRTPDGIAWVMQQGHIVAENGAYLGIRRGCRLHPSRRS